MSESRVCRTCGRRMEARRRWRGKENEVRYCSKRCRSARPNRTDLALEESILALLAGRARGATICPSEAARAVAPDAWRPLLERTRCAARRLIAAGRLDMLQRGQIVDASSARGPVRLRLRT
ncbi:MAG: DUF3253 domain-containing protein [Pseudomonadota bacterium]